MSGRVLVVDDVETNVLILKRLLEREYYEVRTAHDAAEAAKIAESGWPDLIILDVVMPDEDGVVLCDRLKRGDNTQHIPVIIITSLESHKDRVRALAAGADDFLTKPVVPLALFTRVRALLRLRGIMEEVLRQARTSEAIGLMANLPKFIEVDPVNARVMVVVDDDKIHDDIQQALQAEKALVKRVTAQEVSAAAASFEPEVVCLQFDTDSYDALRVVSQLRSLHPGSEAAIVIIGQEADERRLVRGIEMGVTDYAIGETNSTELAIRLRTQVRRLRYTHKLREHFYYSLQSAVTDALTGLYNRTYMDRHLDRLMTHTITNNGKLAILLVDLDHFKYVNDTWGHQIGDEVLVEFSHRLRSAIRAGDLACRYGGEEFIAIMPDAGDEARTHIAERLRKSVSSKPFVTSDGNSINVTVSIGAASYPNSSSSNAQSADLLHQADLALYEAKRTGRNRVVNQPAA